MKWLLLDTGPRQGAWNMRCDEALALGFQALNRQPVLRLYGWSPHAISLGANQHPEEFDDALLRAAGLDLVRRPTGGRAILHAHELTYSVVLPSEGRGARELYHYLSRAILAALTAMGIPASAAPADERPAATRENPLTIPCFSVATRSEIQVDGKKIVGSAQRRYGDVILQHGSFLLGTGHRHIGDYLAAHIRDSRQLVEEHLIQRTTEAETVLGRNVTYGEAAEAFRTAFGQTLEITFDVLGEDAVPWEAIQQPTVEAS